MTFEICLMGTRENALTLLYCLLSNMYLSICKHLKVEIASYAGLLDKVLEVLSFLLQLPGESFPARLNVLLTYRREGGR